MRFVLRSQRHLADLRAALPDLLARVPSARVVTVNLHPEHKAVLEGETEVVLTEQARLPVRVGDVTLLLGPKSFFQTNTEVAGSLYRQARNWVDDADPAVVWDLYCGVGGFALHATGPGRTVVGIETSAEAVEAARASARLHTDAVGPASVGVLRFEVGDATTATPSPAPDLVVVNPPRRGIGPGSPAGSRHRARARSSTPAATSTRWPATSPRCRRCGRSTGGVFDLFPQTRHTEVMVRLERR